MCTLKPPRVLLADDPPSSHGTLSSNVVSEADCRKFVLWLKGIHSIAEGVNA